MPAPPESVRSSRRDCTSAERCSITSAGTPATPEGEAGRAQPVLRGARTGAPDLEDRGHERLAVLRVLAAPDAEPDRVGAARQQPLRQRLGQCAEDGAGHEVPDQVPRRHRRRIDAVEDRAERRADVHRAERALVVRHIGAIAAFSAKEA